MIFNKCPECGNSLTQEMIDANMCWECGKILDESQLDDNILEEIAEQSYEIDRTRNPKYTNHMLTTSSNFANHNIVKYIGLVSGETVIGTGFLADVKASISDLFGVELNAYSDKMKRAKQIAVYDMIDESVEKGGNAIIGVSYTYVTFAGSNLIGVSVNGTSVVVEE